MLPPQYTNNVKIVVKFLVQIVNKLIISHIPIDYNIIRLELII